MKKLLLSFVAIAIFTLCTPPQKKNETEKQKVKETVELKDFGTHPLVINIEDYTKQNINFRTAIWTGENLQLTVMSIPVGGEVGLEMHDDIDQFLRIEEGEAQVLMGNTAENLDFVRSAGDDDVILVPAGKWHNIVNTGNNELKIYSIYAKPEHPHGTVHTTKVESDAAEHSH